MRSVPRIAARLRLGHACKQRAQIIPQPDIRSRIGARGAPDRRLVDIDDLVDLLDAFQLPYGPTTRVE